MTLAATTPRVQYAGAGSTGPFAIPFKIFAAPDLLVIRRSAAGVETTLLWPGDFTVTGVLDPTGTLTLAVALAVGETLTIRRSPPLTQPMSIRNQGAYFPATIEDEDDRLVMQLQELRDRLDRSIKLKESIAGAPSLVELEPTAGQVVTGTGSGFTMSTIATAAAVALPGNGRTVSTLSAYLINNAFANLKDFGLTDGGVFDTPFALAKAALPTGGVILVPHTSSFYLANTQFSTPDGVPYIIQGEGRSSVIKKNFNGDLFNPGMLSTWIDLFFEGDGATRTGRGAVISTGAVDLVSYRDFERCVFNNFAGIPIEFTVGLAGYNSHIYHSILSPTNPATACCKMPGPGVEANGNREISFCWMNGPVDCAGCNNLTLVGNQGYSPILTPNSTKVRAFGNRFVLTALTIDGVNTNFVGNAISGIPITFASTCNTCVYIGEVDAGTGVTDNSNGTNFIDISRQGAAAFTPTWGGGGAIGNGTIVTKWSRRGQTCKLNIVLTIGSTTTLGGAPWTFTMPYVAAANETGQIRIHRNSPAQEYVGVCYTGSGFNVLSLDVAGNTAAIAAAVPFAWLAGDVMYIDIDFWIQ